MKNKNRLNVPFEQRSSINPEMRQKVFQEIYEGYTQKFGIKLLYAYLNHDPNIMVDYCVIYKARNDADTTNLIIYDVAPLFSDRSTPSYLYYKRMHQVDKFFQYGIDEAVIMDQSRFFEFLRVRLELNRKKGDPNYWKNPVHGGELCDSLLELSLEYVKKDRSH
jgi:hypothetical protein